MLKQLGDRARDAGGDPPLPERPDTRHLAELETLTGNEQLLAVLDRHDQLVANLNQWDKARQARRRADFPRSSVCELLPGMPAGSMSRCEVEPQIEAIVVERQLLDASDPVPGLASKLTDALRSVLAESQKHYDGTRGRPSSKRLEEAESWRKD